MRHKSANRATFAAILVLSLAGLALANDAPGEVKTVTTGPECSSAPPLFLDILKKVPAPPADGLCSWLIRPDGAQPSTCELIAVIETALSSGSGRNRSCDVSAQYPLEGGPQPLDDLRPLPPASFDDVPSTYAAEGATFYWLYTVVRNLENWLPCALEGQAWPPPAGWEVHTTLTLTEEGESVPFGAVMFNPSTSQVVVALRGTITAYEWVLDWQYNQTVTSPDVFPTPVHAGFGQAFGEVWPDIEAAMEELVVVNSTASQVFVVGHSLGAATATLVSYATQQYLNQQLAEAAPVVSAVLVAPPNTGPSEFVSDFNQLVNARRLAFEDDIVPQAFCTPTMPACSPSEGGGLGGRLSAASAGFVPTNQPGNVSAWSYSQIGGSLPIQASEMPQDTAAWPALDNIQLCWAFEFLAATHICSYTCFTSQFAPGTAATQRNNCWLTERPEGAVGSSCPGWPPVSAYPGMAGAAAPAPSL